jgi:choline monooxygenase
MILPQNYIEDKALEEEKKLIFFYSWIFVGLKLELSGLSHRGIKVGDKNLIIQCDSNGKFRAFLNVCSHRNAQLCEVGKHSGAIRCPYHGWSYDREGIPAGIPQKHAFPQVTANPENFRLREFECDSVGEFIFVRLSDHGQTLREYLGSQYDFLDAVSIGIDKIEDEFLADVSANWKVVIENSLEGYHVPAVHSSTFMNVDGMGQDESAPKFFFDDTLHSYLEHAANTAWTARFKRMAPKIGTWPFRFEHYTHHFIYPNLTVTSFLGYSFHIQRFDPIATDSTSVHSLTVGVKFQGATSVGLKLMAQIYEDGHAFTRKVFLEDSGICRKVQAGLQNSERTAIFAEGLEDRVRHFQEAYLRSMTDYQGQKLG